MRIAYVGNFQPNVPAADRWSTEHQVAATLEELGHRVLRLQEQAVGWDVVADVAGTCDLMLWTTTWSTYDMDGARRMLAALRAELIPTASFHLDLYWGLSSRGDFLKLPFFYTDRVYTADGGHQEQWREAGVNHEWSPPAIYGPDAVLGEAREEYRRPVAFVGSFPYPHVEWAEQRRMLIYFMRRAWPSSWVWRSGIRGRQLADLYASTDVLIGDSCLPPGTSHYWSDRVPETLGRGGFLVHPWVEGIEEQYVDGVHLRLWDRDDVNQLQKLVGYYLEHPEERRRIAIEGQRHVRENHTYTHRLRRVVEATVRCGT